MQGKEGKTGTQVLRLEGGADRAGGLPPPQQREEVQDVRETRAVHQARRNPRYTLKGSFLEITFVSTVFFSFYFV